MANPAAERSGAALKVIAEYSGEGNVAEWIEKAEFACQLHDVIDESRVLPLKLVGDAYAVYQQMPADARKSAGEIKTALRVAFGINPFSAWNQFVSRTLRSGESPDVYLAALLSLAKQFGGLPDGAVMCKFVAGLPEGVRQTMRIGATVEAMTVAQVLARARAVLRDVGADAAASVIEPREEALQSSVCAVKPAVIPQRAEKTATCRRCKGQGHAARDCPRRSGPRRCYKCDEVGHFIANCPGNAKAGQV